MSNSPSFQFKGIIIIDFLLTTLISSVKQPSDEKLSTDQKHDKESYDKAPAKRSQHANATYRNIVGRNMLRAFATLLRCVATCWVLLAQVWKLPNLS